MHELAIAKDIVRRALVEAEHAPSVTAIHIALGPDGEYNRDALSFSLTVAAQGTPMEGALILISESHAGGVVLNGVDVEEVV